MSSRGRGRGGRGGFRSGGSMDDRSMGYRRGGGMNRGYMPFRHRGHIDSSRRYSGYDNRSGPLRRNDSREHSNPEVLLANLAPERQLALTKALVAQLLNTEGSRGSRRGYGGDRHESSYGPRDYRREGRGRSMRDGRERHPYPVRRYQDRPYREEGPSHLMEEPRSKYRSDERYRGSGRKRSPYGHEKPHYKRPRVEEKEDDRGSSRRHAFEKKEDRSVHSHRDGESRSRSKDASDRDGKGSSRSASKDASGERVKSWGSISPEGSNDEWEKASRGSRRGEGASPKPSREKVRRDAKERDDGDDRSGVSVTVRADGKRAVNSEGRMRSRVSGKLFVELSCPQCPGQRSITFKEYKYHLTGNEHYNRMRQLARKHSIILRRIRLQQRNEQKELEDEWKEEKPDEFKDSVSKFCILCKLAFKCKGASISEGVAVHERSKLHRMQKRYLNPCCSVCRMTFTSRMVYENHLASIHHLKAQTASLDEGKRKREHSVSDEEADSLDFANFMTVDSVGEDDEDVGSEHDEIVAGMEEAEEAIKNEELPEDDGRRKTRKRKHSWIEEQLLDDDWEDGDEVYDFKSSPGIDYIEPREFPYCTLCKKVFSLSKKALQVHCSSEEHVLKAEEKATAEEESKEEEDVAGDDESEEKEEDVSGDEEYEEEEVGEDHEEDWNEDRESDKLEYEESGSESEEEKLSERSSGNEGQEENLEEEAVTEEVGDDVSEENEDKETPEKKVT